MWAEYFEQVLNVEDVREANINVSGNWRMPVLGDFNKLKSNIDRGSKRGSERNVIGLGSRAGWRTPVECLNKCCMTVLEWLVRLLNSSLVWG